ncbi:hypothetical protein LCGC14_2291660 [marine sediment metagenome]|uniref:Helix-turn-helix domain-containing protein n=1 Tax=marine sediment metagenome TaxID=412755 RepID=A0A0F9FLA2_9ZZZZ
MTHFDNRIPVQEAAIQLGLSRESVMRRLATGELEGGKDGLSGRWYVTRESVERYLAKQQQAAAS